MDAPRGTCLARPPGMTHSTTRVVIARTGHSPARLLASLLAVAFAGAGGCTAMDEIPDERLELGEVSSALEPQVLCNEVFSLDHAQALQTCFARVAPGGTVLLPAGVGLVLQTPVVIARPLILTTQGKGPGQVCDPRLAHGCAVIHTSPTSPHFNNPDTPALRVTVSDVSLRNLAFNFHLRSIGIQVESAVRFSAFDNGLQNARRAAMVITNSGGAGAVIERNFFFNNGARTPAHNQISDGLTVHQASSARIVGNWFLDNTDVQLILGACTNCTIASNDIRHSGDPARASYAAFALHSFFASQSGVFTGSSIFANVIDCHPSRRCGFGIYLGDYSWLPPPGGSNPVNGGHIHSNSTSYAQVGMYIDHAVNTRIDDSNTFFIPGGTFPCLDPLSRRYSAAVLSLPEDPRPGGLVQIDFSTALNLFLHHRLNQNLIGCVPNGF
jgi:hypothetical protein